MNKQTLIKRLALLRKNPDVVKPFENAEIAQIFLMLIDHMEEVQSDIKAGKIKGDAGRDAIQPVADVDYMSKRESKKMILDLMKEAASTLNKQVQDGVDGLDAEVTEEHVKEAAERAFNMIELPNFTELITKENQAVRDGLELLPIGEKLSPEALEGWEGIEQKIENALKNKGGQGGGGISRTVVQTMIDAIPAAEIPDVAFVGTSARKGSTQSVSTTLTDILFNSTSSPDSTRFDTDDIHDPSSNSDEFTVPSDGYYKANAYVETDTGNLSHIGFTVNGTLVDLLFRSGGIGSGNGVAHNRVLNLSAGDVVTVQVRTAAGSATIGTDSFMEVYKL